MHKLGPLYLSGPIRASEADVHEFLVAYTDLVAIVREKVLEVMLEYRADWDEEKVEHVTKVISVAYARCVVSTAYDSAFVMAVKDLIRDGTVEDAQTTH